MFENKKDLDYEIKSALGKQGIIGLVMTPKATFAGAYQDKSIAWQVDELEIDIIENVTVNRGKREGYVSGQDASMRLFDVLCPLSGDNEGKFCPVSYEEGEDNNLLVNKCILTCHVWNNPPDPPDPALTRVKYTEASGLPDATFNIVGELASDSIANKGQAEEIDIGNAVTSLGFEALSNCGNLRKVTIPDSVTTLDEGAFSYCSNLTSVTIPSGVRSIGDFVFYWCGLTSVTISEGVTSIGGNAFDGCEQLTSIAIPNSVTSIGGYAFYRCTNLTNATIGNGIADIGILAFLECYELKNLTFMGKTLAQVEALPNYSWGIDDERII